MTVHRQTTTTINALLCEIFIASFVFHHKTHLTFAAFELTFPPPLDKSYGNIVIIEALSSLYVRKHAVAMRIILTILPMGTFYISDVYMQRIGQWCIIKNMPDQLDSL